MVSKPDKIRVLALKKVEAEGVDTGLLLHLVYINVRFGVDKYKMACNNVTKVLQKYFGFPVYVFAARKRKGV